MIDVFNTIETTLRKQNILRYLICWKNTDCLEKLWSLPPWKTSCPPEHG